MKKNFPYISIITPVFNSEKHLPKLVESISKLNYEKNKIESIMVLDVKTNEASKKTLKKLKTKYKFLKIIQNKKNGSAANRNLAIKHANKKSKYFAFTDSDCIVHKDWLMTLVNKIENTNADVVGGINLIPNTKSEVATHSGILEQTFFGGAGTTQGSKFTKDKYVMSIPNCNAMYKRILWEKNKQNESLIVGQDGEFNYRLYWQGKKLLLTPKAIVYHHREDSIPRFKKKMYKYGVATSKILKIHIKTLAIRWYSFFLLAGFLFFILSLFLSIYSKAWQSISLLLIIVYLFIHIATILESKKLSKTSNSFLISKLLFYQHLYYSIGLLSGLFK